MRKPASAYDVIAGPYGCEIWTKPGDTQGYIHIKENGQREKAHHRAYREAYGEIPEGYVIDHTCHNEALARGECHRGKCLHRACINKLHLVAKLNSENIRDARSVLETCHRGHDLTDSANLKPTKRGSRQCRACVRINTRISRGYTESEALEMEIKFLASRA